MGKHRGGDAIKSLRFARKALDLYSQALSKYPRNFDLAYNKARLELEIATHPTLVKALDVPVIDVLQQALQSHRYTLSLDPENADTLFNAAQVLTTIAEYIANDDMVPDAETLKYLEQAIEYQSQCLQIQETKFAESRQFHEAAMKQSLEDDDDGGGAKLDPTTTSAFEDHDEQQEQWVSIVEPVTANTLIDTILSQLSTLTTLCTIITSTLTSSPPASPSTLPISLSWIESYSSELLSGTLPSLTSSNAESLLPRTSEIHRTQAILTSALLELAYHTGHITPETYIDKLNTAFSLPSANAEPAPAPDPETSIAHARALITLNSALADSPPSTSTPTASASAAPAPATATAAAGPHRWTALTTATNLLTTLSHHLPATDAHTQATTHQLRGDIALLTRALADPPVHHAAARANRDLLLRNARVFYRNATKLFGTVGGAEEEGRSLAELRGAVVDVLVQTQTQTQTVQQVQEILRNASRGKTDAWRREKLVDMVDEGLVSGELFGM